MSVNSLQPGLSSDRHDTGEHWATAATTQLPSARNESLISGARRCCCRTPSLSTERKLNCVEQEVEGPARSQAIPLLPGGSDFDFRWDR